MAKSAAAQTETSETQSSGNEPVNLRALLSQTSNTVERPRSLPDGNYIAEIMNHEFDRSSKKQTPLVRYYFRVIEATEDVMEDTEGYNFEDFELRQEFYLTPKSLYRLVDFLDAVLGSDESRSIDSRIPEVENARVMIQVSRQMTEEGRDSGYNRIGKVVAA